MAFEPTMTLNHPVGSRSWLARVKSPWFAAFVLPLVIGPVWYLICPAHGGRLCTLAGLVLVATLIAGAITDLQRRRIYNWTTYTAFLWAIAINVAASGISADPTPVFDFQPAAIAGPAWLGGVGIWQCLAGAAVCFAITVVGYDLSGGGAGDVKIAAVIGALLGVHQGFYAVIYSYIIAAVAIVVWAVWTHGPFSLAKAISRTLGAKLGPLWPFTPSDADAKLLLTPVPLGPYFAIGTLLVALELLPT